MAEAVFEEFVLISDDDGNDRYDLKAENFHDAAMEALSILKWRIYTFEKPSQETKAEKNDERS